MYILTLLVSDSFASLQLSYIRQRLLAVPSHINVNVTNLNLKQNEISEIKEDDFQSMGLLEELYLQNNRIESIHDDAFRDLTKVWHLDLASNNLQELGEPLFRNLVNLRALYISSNKLMGLPVLDRAALSLATLDLSYNRISNLPGGYFQNMASLYTLYLTGNSLTSLKFPDLSGLVSLNSLGISSNRITSFNSQVFQGLTSLTHVNIRSNEITEFPCIALYSEQTDRTLTFSASYNKIESITNECITALLRFKQLSLYLNNNELDSIDLFEPLIPLLLEFAISGNGFNHFLQGDGNSSWILESLSLEGSNFTTCPVFPLGMRNSTKELHLGGNGMECIDSEHLKGFDSLNTLELNDNKLTSFPSPNCSSVVPSGMVMLPVLEKLVLANNKITLIPNLTFVPELEELDMKGNLLEDVDTTLLVGLVYLKKVDFSLNDILEFPDFGNIGDTNNVQKLNLSYNKIKIVTWNLLSRVSNLKELYLGDNSIKAFLDDYKPPGVGVDSSYNEPLSIITKLILPNNQLTKFSSTVVRLMSNMKKLNLTDNMLKTFTDLSYRYNGGVSLTLSLSGNPLDCDNRLCWLKDEDQGKVIQTKWSSP